MSRNRPSPGHSELHAGPAAERLSLLSLAAGNFAVGTGALMITGLVVEIANNVSVSQAAAGQLIGIYALIYALTAAPLSVVTSRWCPKTTLRIALAGFCVTNLAAAFTSDFSLLLLFRATTAVFAAMFTPLASAVATRLVPEERAGAALGLVFGGFATATVLGAPLGTFLGGALGWSVAFVLVAVLAGLGFLAIQASLPGTIDRSPLKSSDLISIARHRTSLAALTTTTLQVTAQFVVFTFLSVMLTTTLDAEATLIASMLLVFGIASVAGSFLGAGAADRFGIRRTVLVSLSILSIALLLTGTFGWGLTWTCLVLTLWGLSGFAFNPAQQLLLIRLQPDQRNLLLALNASAIYLGNFIGATLGGVLLERFEQASLSLAAALTAAATALWFSQHSAPGGGACSKDQDGQNTNTRRLT